MNILGKTDRGSVVVTIAMLLLALATAILAWISVRGDALIMPWRSYRVDELGAKYYMGVSVYITISATLFTSAAIRFALRFSK